MRSSCQSKICSSSDVQEEVEKLNTYLDAYEDAIKKNPSRRKREVGKLESMIQSFENRVQSELRNIKEDASSNIESIKESGNQHSRLIKGVRRPLVMSPRDKVTAKVGGWGVKSVENKDCGRKEKEIPKDSFEKHLRKCYVRELRKEIRQFKKISEKSAKEDTAADIR